MLFVLSNFKFEQSILKNQSIFAEYFYYLKKNLTICKRFNTQTIRTDWSYHNN